MPRGDGDFSECLSTKVLAALAEGLGTVAAREHASTCERCGRAVDLIRRAKLVGLDEIGDALDDVAELINSILGEPPHRWERIVAQPEYHYPEVARRLLAIAIDARARDARLATCASRAAAVIADAISIDAQATHDLRFEIWKTHAALLREIGAFSDVRAALVRAEEAAEWTTDVEVARASILLSRALIAADPDVWEPEEAFALLDRAEAVFVRRDEERYRRTRTTRAMLLRRCGRAEEAFAIFESVAAETPESDLLAHADALANLAVTALDLGRSDSAALLMERVEETDRQFGNVVNIARDLWLGARIASARGQHDDAAVRATAAMTEFQHLGLTAEQIRAGLTAVRSLTALGEVSEALSLCRLLASASMELDRREPTRRRILTTEAVSYLRDVAERAWLTVDLVAAVEGYVQDISDKPPTRFTPPVSLEPM